MKIRDIPKKYAKYVHPIYRNLIVRNRSGKLKVQRSAANKVKRKMFYLPTIPRTPVFYCEVCTLSSRYLRVVREHICSMVNESRHIVSFENEVRIAHVGFKSKAKDSWAVMERLPNPQHVQLLWKINRDEEDGGEAKKNPLSLRDICLNKIRLPEDEGDFTPWENDFDPMSREELQQKERNLELIGKNRRTGESAWQCNICHRVFGLFADHDDHLAEGDCMSKGLCDPIEINPFDSTLGYSFNWKPKLPALSDEV